MADRVVRIKDAPDERLVLRNRFFVCEDYNTPKALQGPCLGNVTLWLPSEDWRHDAKRGTLRLLLPEVEAAVWYLRTAPPKALADAASQLMLSLKQADHELPHLLPSTSVQNIRFYGDLDSLIGPQRHREPDAAAKVRLTEIWGQVVTMATALTAAENQLLGM